MQHAPPAQAEPRAEVLHDVVDADDLAALGGIISASAFPLSARQRSQPLRVARVTWSR